MKTITFAFSFFCLLCAVFIPACTPSKTVETSPASRPVSNLPPISIEQAKDIAHEFWKKQGLEHGPITAHGGIKDWSLSAYCPAKRETLGLYLDIQGKVENFGAGLWGDKNPTDAQPPGDVATRPAYPKAHGCYFSNSTFDYILKRAQQGYAFEQYGIGSWYANGINVTKDMAEAIKWYRKAAEQGNVSAQCNLGNCYLQGEGVAKDAVEAVKWYRKAAERDDSASQINLAYCHIEGKGVAEDETEGLAWLYIVNSREGRPYGGLLLSKITFLENRIGPEKVAAAKKRAEELKKMIEAKKREK